MGPCTRALLWALCAERQQELCFAGQRGAAWPGPGPSTLLLTGRAREPKNCSGVTCSCRCVQHPTSWTCYQYFTSLGKEVLLLSEGCTLTAWGCCHLACLRMLLVTHPWARAGCPRPLDGLWTRCWCSCAKQHDLGPPSAHPTGTIVFSWSTAPCSSKSHRVTACALLVLCHNLTCCLFQLGGDMRD